MINRERARKTPNVPEPSREGNIYVIMRNIRTKENIDGIYDVTRMI
jgi:hypothetical protein